jgi:hypothetical protein
MKKNKLNLALFVTGLVCMIMSMGVFAPEWLNLFGFARSFLPFFSMIRTPGRFIMSSYFSFIFLASITVGIIAEKIGDYICSVKWRNIINELLLKSVDLQHVHVNEPQRITNSKPEISLANNNHKLFNTVEKIKGWFFKVV